MAQAVAKDLGCEQVFAHYLQTLPPVVPLRRPPEAVIELPPASSARDPRIPPTGTVLVRHFGDRDYRVTVTDEGFMLGRHRYRSLSAVAKAITGKHCSGCGGNGRHPSGTLRTPSKVWIRFDRGVPKAG